jgi:hypothetical protein
MCQYLRSPNGSVKQAIYASPGFYIFFSTILHGLLYGLVAWGQIRVTALIIIQGRIYPIAGFDRCLFVGWSLGDV